MWKIIIMAENKDDSIVHVLNSEDAANLAFELAEQAGECANLWHDGRRVRGDWTRTKSGRRVHKSCLDNYNECMDCGIDRGQCSDPRCWLAGAS
jgi:hypothetical protein